MRQRRKRRGLLSRLYAATVGKIGTLNLVLILVGAFFLWFNAQMLAIFRETGAIPETYACAVLTCTLGECGICGWIRTNKDRRQEREWDKEDRKKQKEPEEPAEGEQHG